MRYLINISYNGNNYHGWQKQNYNNTIEEEIEKKASVILKKNINIIGASRTDSRVHAVNMYAHFDYKYDIVKNFFLYKINLLIPKDIYIKDIKKIKPNIHARFDAKYRVYQYLISYKKRPFNNNLYWYWYYKKKIDIDLMNKALKIIINRKNFSLFTIKKKSIKNNFFCNLYFATWKKKGNKIFLFIKSNRFLRKMVRIIVSICLEIGIKKKTLDGLKNEIKTKKIIYNIDPPPYALYLINIKYNKNIYL